MSSFDAIEFEQLIGDQLITVGRGYTELENQGPIEITLDGHPMKISRVMRPRTDASGRAIAISRTTIYDAANELYVKRLRKKNPIPLLCHREHLTPVAVCRACVVAIEGAPRLAPACQRVIEPGMVISTILTSDKVRSAVRTLVELLMSDYRAARGDNVQIGESGENELEALAKTLGVDGARFPAGGLDRPRDDSSMLIAVDLNACILCDRCIRGCNEVRHNEVLGRMGKGYATQIAFDLNNPMGESSCVTCGECMVSCPTGALTNRAVVGDTLKDAHYATVPADELASHALFAGISRSFLQWNRNAVKRRRYKKGEVICREGEYGSTAFIMEKGRFEVRLKSPLSHVENRKGSVFGFFSGFKQALVAAPRKTGQGQYIPVDGPLALEYGDPVAVLTPDDILFGEMTCMSNYPRAATVTALEDCTVLEILRNVLYMLQRNQASRDKLEDVYRRRTLETHLRSAKVFAALLPDADDFRRFVDFLRPQVRLVRVHPGQAIFRQGEPADHFYMVRSGFIKVTESRQGVERVLNYVGPGGYFGEIGLLGRVVESLGMAKQGLRTATCSALDHVDLVRVRGDAFLQLIDMFPKVREHMVEIAGKTLVESERKWADLERVSLGEFLNQGLMHAGNVLVLDLERCTRCDECTKACADSHDGVTRLIREGLRFDRYLVASSCRSCLDPVCLVGCPTAAITRTDGGDIIIKDTCIGCGKCAESCPYGNINMVGIESREIDPRNAKRLIAVQRQKATTCDKCNGTDPPSCVFACPHDAAHRMTGQELLQLVEGANA